MLRPILPRPTKPICMQLRSSRTPVGASRAIDSCEQSVAPIDAAAGSGDGRCTCSARRPAASSDAKSPLRLRELERAERERLIRDRQVLARRRRDQRGTRRCSGRPCAAGRSSADSAARSRTSSRRAARSRTARRSALQLVGRAPDRARDRRAARSSRPAAAASAALGAGRRERAARGRAQRQRDAAVERRDRPRRSAAGPRSCTRRAARWSRPWPAGRSADRTD